MDYEMPRLMRKGNYAERVGAVAPVYLAAVLECLTAEILELAGDIARANKKPHITLINSIVRARFEKVLEEVTLYTPHHMEEMKSIFDQEEEVKRISNDPQWMSPTMRV
ncbi:histone H2A-like [Coregonus clupeaformis]|uniref:histone H2A-like n=1 Tax=Coregonus clupeaformis TaxID=59861 RepID=UPI001BE055B6|nr:histone H2A-like [Coregonus clupeaformis]